MSSWMCKYIFSLDGCLSHMGLVTDKGYWLGKGDE